MRAPFTTPARSHLGVAIGYLLQQGWIPQSIPAGARLARNGQAIALRLPAREVRLRLFVYKVTVSSRGRPAERRIEITSTYPKGLRPRPGFQEVVVGWDATKKIYVGVDPRRILHGGPTGNASSFFDKSGLDWRRANEISIRARYNVRLFPSRVEFHAFFKPSCIAEYLLNVRDIHANSYTPGARLSIRRSRSSHAPALTLTATGDVLVLSAAADTARRKVPRRLIEAVSSGDSYSLTRLRLTPDELAAIQREREANGQLGERRVLDLERRGLRRAGRSDLADRIRWISQESVLAGFDILSFYPDGREKWIEVKSTSGKGKRFLMSDNEWLTAQRAKSKYHLYRVTEVRSRSPQVKRFANFASLEARGALERRPAGWLITLR